MSVMSQFYSVIIDRGINAPEHGKEVVDGPNAVYKHYTYKLMSNVKLPVLTRFDYQIQINTGNQKYYVRLAMGFQHHLTKEHRKYGFFIKAKTIKNSWK